MGLAYLGLRWPELKGEHGAGKAVADAPEVTPTPAYRAVLIRVAAIVFTTTAVSSIIFQATTFALPKIFEERLQGLAAELSAWVDGAGASGQGDVATVIGSLAFVVFAVASAAQLVVGGLLDRFGPRRVFMAVAALQLVFFSLISPAWSLPPEIMHSGVWRHQSAWGSCSLRRR